MTDHETSTAPVLRSIRVAPSTWGAWGRVLGRLSTNRTARIQEMMRADIEQYGDEADLEDLAAGDAARQEAAARKQLGRLPTPAAPMAGDARESEEDPDTVQAAAMRHAREHFPQASAAHRAAFANAVTQAVTGWTGGWGGPRVREHAAERLAGRLTYDEAVQQLGHPEGVIFGPITPLHRQCWCEEECFDDDPEDLQALRSS